MVSIKSFEHWCTDGGCGSEIIKHEGAATLVRRWKVTLIGTRYAWGFNTNPEALAFCAKYGYKVVD